MHKTDRFLIGIIAGITALVIVALVIALRQPEQTYREDDAPDAVVHNYLLALHRQEYARAYECLSPTLPGYPETAEDFGIDVMNNPWNFGEYQEATGFVIGDTRMPVPDNAWVMVHQRSFQRDGLLGSSQYDQQFEMQLSRVNGQWRLVNSESHKFWAWCWNDAKGCHR